MDSDTSQAPVVSDEVDIEDVSLIDTPDVAPADTPSQSEDETPAEGTETQDEPQEAPSEAEGTTATEETPQTADERKVIAQREFQQRQRARQEIAQKLDQEYGPKTEQDLIEEGVSPEQAQIQALREEISYREQRAQISELNASMQTDAVVLQQDFPIFNPNSPEYDPEFTQMVDQQYFQAARLQTADLADGTKVIVNAEAPLYDFYKQMADIYSRGASKGSQQGQQEAMQMLSRTETPGGSSSAGSSGDSLADLEDRLGDVVIT